MSVGARWGLVVVGVMVVVGCGDEGLAERDGDVALDVSFVEITSPADTSTSIDDTNTSIDDTSTSTSIEDTSTSTSNQDSSTSTDDTSTSTSNQDSSTSTSTDDTSTSTSTDDTSTSTSPQDTSTSTSTQDSSTSLPDTPVVGLCSTFTLDGALEAEADIWIYGYGLDGDRDLGLGGPAPDTFLFDFYSEESGSFDLGSGKNGNYARCDQCVAAFVDLDGEGEPAVIFFQRAGTLGVGAAPGSAAMTLTLGSVVLEEVTLDPVESSTPVPGGDCLVIPDVTVSTP